VTEQEAENQARRPIHWDDSLREVLLKMAEDNPSAMRVLLKILGKTGPGGLSLILQLDDMNIRGKQLWVGYRYHCDADLDRFVQCVKERDPEMIETINREGRKGLYPHEASRLSGQRRFVGKTEG
jgi:hypothetical protein